MFDQVNQATSRRSIKTVTSLSEIIDMAHDQMRGVTAGYSSLALSLTGTIREVLTEEQREALGWKPRMQSLEGTEEVLNRLAESDEESMPNAYVVFGGQTPENEDRDFVLGNAHSGNVEAVLLMFTDSTTSQQRAFLARPTGELNPSWSTTELPNNIGEVFALFATSPEENEIERLQKQLVQTEDRADALDKEKSNLENQVSRLKEEIDKLTQQIEEME